MASDFLPFSGAAGANVLSQSAYAALASRTSGFSSGVAKSAELNKVWRQSSIMSAVLAQFINDVSGVDSIDDGTITTLLANLKSGLRTSLSGRYTGVSGVTATSTLTASSVGLFLNITASSAVTTTLPLTSAVQHGDTISFQNTSNFDQVISRQGTDNISINGSTDTSVTIRKGDFARFTRAGSFWLMSGSAALNKSGLFESSLLSSGYQKLPSGLIIQWGQVGGVSTGGVTVTFPIAFPNAQLATIPQVSVTTGPVTQYANAVATGTPKSSIIFAVNTGATAVGYVALGY